MKLKNFLIPLMMAVMMLHGCMHSERGAGVDEDSPRELPPSDKPEGLSLAETQCYTCHSPSAPEKERAAPPMVEIKAHYLKTDTSKAAFVKSIMEYVQNPQKEKSRLKDALGRYGVMPKQQYNEADLKKIAAYFFDYRIQEPAWFKEYYQRQTGELFTQHGVEYIPKTKTPGEMALGIAMETKELLGKTLQQKLQQNGAENALEFCNLQAIPLTKSMSDKYHISVKRVSDKPRNPANAANKQEKRYIEQYKQQLAKGETPKPLLVKNELYVPIVTNSMCLNCHGTPAKELPLQVYQKIKMLYPDDRATGYDANQVRGMFVVSLPNQEETPAGR